ncbi:MAG: hypothetical protein NTW68_01880 [candidate division NC10 bacterium]|nr:hypothetical protein [candidate division NC10 bacterium]MCX6908533.1 hypothetical protein [Verrucomicrobiota bacterium]
MGIIWDPDKERKLLAERDIDVWEVAGMIVSGDYLAILENPSRPSQQLFVVRYHEYTHVVPFVIDEDENIILKTVFPSRRFHQFYGESHESET